MQSKPVNYAMAGHDIVSASRVARVVVLRRGVRVVGAGLGRLSAVGVADTQCTEPNSVPQPRTRNEVAHVGQKILFFLAGDCVALGLSKPQNSSGFAGRQPL